MNTDLSRIYQSSITTPQTTGDSVITQTEQQQPKSNITSLGRTATTAEEFGQVEQRSQQMETIDQYATSKLKADGQAHSEGVKGEPKERKVKLGFKDRVGQFFSGIFSSKSEKAAAPAKTEAEAPAPIKASAKFSTPDPKQLKTIGSAELGVRITFFENSMKEYAKAITMLANSNLPPMELQKQKEANESKFNQLKGLHEGLSKYDLQPHANHLGKIVNLNSEYANLASQSNKAAEAFLKKVGEAKPAKVEEAKVEEAKPEKVKAPKVEEPKVENQEKINKKLNSIMDEMLTTETNFLKAIGGARDDYKKMLETKKNDPYLKEYVQTFNKVEPAFKEFEKALTQIQKNENLSPKEKALEVAKLYQSKKFDDYMNASKVMIEGVNISLHLDQKQYPSPDLMNPITSKTINFVQRLPRHRMLLEDLTKSTPGNVGELQKATEYVKEKTADYNRVTGQRDFAAKVTAQLLSGSDLKASLFQPIQKSLNKIEDLKKQIGELTKKNDADSKEKLKARKQELEKEMKTLNDYRLKDNLHQLTLSPYPAVQKAILKNEKEFKKLLKQINELN